MHLCRIQIKNFRNFKSLDVQLDGNAVIIGENRIGKSNLLLAMRLVLDNTLSDSSRQLKLSEICDNHNWQSADPVVEIHLDFTDFQSDTALTALLTDYRVATTPHISRLSYIYRKKADVVGPPKSESDFEFKTYGGDNEARSLASEVRRRICLDVLPALRDAENELGTWRTSPLRPLIEDAINDVSPADLNSIATEMSVITNRMNALPPIAAVEDQLRRKMAVLTGPRQDLKSKLGIAPSDPLRLFRSIRVLIDDGKRGISDASLGSANLALLALKLSEFAWRKIQNERNFTIVCIEEPEAHLHPHLQRSVFRRLFRDTLEEPQSLFLTTLSTHIVSVSPLKSIVLLKSKSREGTKAYSLARLSLSDADKEDIERYLDVSRAEILFSRGIIFVEGDAEAALVPVFSRGMGINLDEMGISICNVGGAHFSPYVKLARSLHLPFVVITDWDVMPHPASPLGQTRALGLIDDMRSIDGFASLDAGQVATLIANAPYFKASVATEGIFLNDSTFEIELTRSPETIRALLGVLDDADFGAIRRSRLTTWRTNPATLDTDQLMAMIADIGKGRLAGRLARSSGPLLPPFYIQQAINHIVNLVSND